ncbi:CocE/NonD family hydrolase [Effusibacillus consociatus]|uniref:CocE/NonD family hydrolase n=1 Tax=Effusibacillus consociatus TaxID=1117041 RepID=A0ABV9Q0U8_9BACL
METFQALIEKNVACSMRDGTILRSDIYRPNDNGSYPVLLTRLPYNKDLPHYAQRFLDPIRAASNGIYLVKERGADQRHPSQNK